MSLLDSGARVIGLEASESRLDAIWAEDVDLLPHDRRQLHQGLRSGRVELTDDAGRLAAADSVIICVPTPITDHLTPDLAALQGACATVVANARPGQTIILTSTTYIGCTRDFLAAPLLERGLQPGHDVFVAFSPERIDPGVPDHVPGATPRVVGGMTPDCTRRATAALTRTCPTVHPVSGCEAAEMTKLLENTFRAVNIALANEVAEIAGHLGLSAREVIDAAATKPYGFMPFYPGPGVGGHCIPCDPHYLLWQLRADRVDSPLISGAMTQISLRPRRVVARLHELLAAHSRPMQGARIHVVGVTYKPGVADVRESPALVIIDECLASGADVSYTDEQVPQLRVGNRTLTSVPGPDVRADAVLVHTDQPGSDLSWLSICRRDGTAVIKKKTVDSPSDDEGTYVTLASARFPCATGTWTSARVEVRTTPAGVRLTFSSGGRAVVSALDDGQGGTPPLRQPGRVGIRGDNTEFHFRDFRVVAADG